MSLSQEGQVALRWPA